MSSPLYLLDTNIVIAFLRPIPEREILQKIAGQDVCLSSIAIGELFYGIEYSSKREENLKRLQNLLDSVIILNCDIETAIYYGRIQAQLRKKGRPIPNNDAWIAAVAFQYGLTVATRDKHFDNIEGLDVEKW